MKKRVIFSSPLAHVLIRRELPGVSLTKKGGLDRISQVLEVEESE